MAVPPGRLRQYPSACVQSCHGRAQVEGAARLSRRGGIVPPLRCPLPRGKWAARRRRSSGAIARRIVGLTETGENALGGSADARRVPDLLSPRAALDNRASVAV